MLHIRVICVGKLKEAYLRDACAEYIKRLGAFCKISVIELPESRLPDSPSAALIEKALEAEAQAILQAAAGSALIPLCIEGTELTSPALASKIQEIALTGHSSISFVIGSSYGLSGLVKKAGIFLLSMSRMTFPHQLARVMVLEQLYRAMTISRGQKYHK